MAEDKKASLSKLQTASVQHGNTAAATQLRSLVFTHHVGLEKDENLKKMAGGITSVSSLNYSGQLMCTGIGFPLHFEFIVND